LFQLFILCNLRYTFLFPGKKRNLYCSVSHSLRLLNFFKIRRNIKLSYALQINTPFRILIAWEVTYFNSERLKRLYISARRRFRLLIKQELQPRRSNELFKNNRWEVRCLSLKVNSKLCGKYGCANGGGGGGRSDFQGSFLRE